jgi:VIT1/CCC1 family predicted Fe2+/Mn2+ transporter
MNLSSPFFVVSVIVVVFTVAILFATSSKEDGPSEQ